jgi:hypothetical protein
MLSTFNYMETFLINYSIKFIHYINFNVYYNLCYFSNKKFYFIIKFKSSLLVKEEYFDMLMA